MQDACNSRNPPQRTKWMIPELELPSPAFHWTDGHVLGNGDVGAAVWGMAARLCVGFSKHDVNDLRGPEPDGARLTLPYPEIRDRFLRGERDVQGMIEQTSFGLRSGQQQLACGRLALELLRGTQPTASAQTLSLAKAEVTVEVCPTVAGWAYGMTHRPITRSGTPARSLFGVGRIDRCLCGHAT
jgi:hypothetical protein